MKIFYVDCDEFLRNHDLDFLCKYSDGKVFKSQKRFIQYSIGRYLVKTIAKTVFGVENTEIVIRNSKPQFCTADLHFSISHSGNIVAAAFDSEECGLDVEQMKPRDFDAFGERYGKKFISKEDFYEFWTEYEAGIKLQHEIKGKFSSVFLEQYMLTAVSVKNENPLVCLIEKAG